MSRVQFWKMRFSPCLTKNIDTVVLGCTHYPFVIPLIEQIVGKNVRVIDPAPSVAKQVKRLLEAAGTKKSIAGTCIRPLLHIWQSR